jgi:hypothetical protein
MLSPKEIVTIDLSVTPAAELSLLNRGVIVSTGGTSENPGTLIKAVDANSVALLPAIEIASISHSNGRMTGQVVNNLPITTIVSATRAATTIVWASGTATVTSTGHGLPVAKSLWVVMEGWTPVEWNGTFFVTVVDANSFTISIANYGAVTVSGTVSYGTITCTHGLPFSTLNNTYYVSVAQSSGSVLTQGFYKKSTPVFPVDASTLIYPLALQSGTAPTLAKLRYIMGTLTAHGLPLNKTVNSTVYDSVPSIPSGNNGEKQLTATDANTFYYATVDASPMISRGRISTALLTTVTAHGQPLGVANKISVTGSSDGVYNGIKAFFGTSTTVLSWAFPTKGSRGLASGGRILDYDALVLQTQLQCFFRQGDTIPVYVLEVGGNTTANNITYFRDWLIANPNKNLNYLVPPAWDITAFAQVASAFNRPQDFIHFFVGLTKSVNKSLFYDAASNTGYKSVVAYIEDPLKDNFESFGAVLLYEASANFPSLDTKLGQLNYRYIKSEAADYTPYSGTDRLDLEDSGISYVDTNAVGLAYPYKIVGGYTGDSVNVGGVTAMFVDYMQWWAVYYSALTLQAALDKRVIDSSNDQSKRLNLDDSGGVQCVSDLQFTAQGIVDNVLVPFGVINDTQVKADAYPLWKAQNTALYIAKKYTGLSVKIVPRRGFREMVVKMNANFNG